MQIGALLFSKKYSNLLSYDSHILYLHLFSTVIVIVCRPFHPTAPEPPCDISVDRKPPNADKITITWSEPNTGAPPTGYMIIIWPVDEPKDVRHIEVEGGNATTIMISVDPTKLKYGIIIITLSATLPSKPSLIVYSKM